MLAVGGGEVLAEAVRFPPTAVATESWPPNIARATRLLHPRGVVVVADPDEPPLPFAEAAFDLVTSRHPATIWWDEIARAGGVDPGYARTGRIQPADPGDRGRIEARISAAAGNWPAGFDMRLTSDPEAALVPDSPGGLWLVDNLTARLAPRRACAALAAAVRAAGGEIVEEAAAADAEPGTPQARIGALEPHDRLFDIPDQ